MERFWIRSKSACLLANRPKASIQPYCAEFDKSLNSTLKEMGASQKELLQINEDIKVGSFKMVGLKDYALSTCLD